MLNDHCLSLLFESNQNCIQVSICSRILCHNFGTVCRLCRDRIGVHLFGCLGWDGREEEICFSQNSGIQRVDEMERSTYRDCLKFLLRAALTLSIEVEYFTCGPSYLSRVGWSRWLSSCFVLGFCQWLQRMTQGWTEQLQPPSAAKRSSYTSHLFTFFIFSYLIKFKIHTCLCDFLDWLSRATGNLLRVITADV